MPENFHIQKNHCQEQENQGDLRVGSPGNPKPEKTPQANKAWENNGPEKQLKGVFPKFSKRNSGRSVHSHFYAGKPQNPGR